MPKMPTRILIISDMHGRVPEGVRPPPVDIAIHCGDLTDHSRLDEYRTTIEYLKSLDAAIKLVIAGNHDVALDEEAFDELVTHADTELDSEDVTKWKSEARRLFEEAATDGIRFLSEGNHEVLLADGSLLRVYASPFTPGVGGMGFQYTREQGHVFDIAENTDIVITHGPPRGIFDLNHEGQRTGCPDLFKVIARARPRIHAFGHIHESWGAKYVAWNSNLEGIGEPNHFNAIDNDASELYEKLSTLRVRDGESEGARLDKARKAEMYAQEGCVRIRRFSQEADKGENVSTNRRGTLFVNAALQGNREDGELDQLPWLVRL